MAKKKEEKSSWNELCDYVKREILEYDENMKFPKYLALKLQGLKKVNILQIKTLGHLHHMMILQFCVRLN